MTEPVDQHLDWMRQRNLRKDTIYQRRCALLRLRRRLGKDPALATREDLEVWQRSLALIPSSTRTELVHVTQYYKYLYREGLISADPSVFLIKPQLPQRFPRPMPETALHTALENAPADIRLMLVLAAYEGLRAGEMSRIDRADIIDGNTPPVMRIDGKGGRTRVVPLSARVLRELRMFGHAGRGPLFRRRDGRPGHVRPHRISQMVNDYLRGMGIAHTCHSLRARFGTEVYALTPDLRIAQDLMGHSSPATTALYVQGRDARSVRAVERLGGILMIHPTTKRKRANVPSMKSVTFILGGVLFVLGLGFGFIPVQSSGVNCGSVFVASDDAGMRGHDRRDTGRLRRATHVQ